MKKFFLISGYTVLSILVLIYLGFLFVLPRAVDINKFKPDIQKIAKEQANLGVNFENAKIITTPLLGAGIKADNISIKLPDESVLFSAESFRTRISLPSLLLLTVKVSCLEINKPFVNLEIANDNDFKLLSYVEDLLNANKEQQLEVVQAAETEGFKFNPEWIRIKVPCVKLNNYKVLVNDLKSKHFLDLHGEELTLGYFNGKFAKIKTNAEFYSDENKNITANININTFLPKPPEKLDNEDDPAERIDIPFINPVTMYRKYDLKADLDTKLRIRNKNNQITSQGYLNVENVTMKVSALELPKSYLRLKTFGTNITTDTDIYVVKDQNIRLLGKLNYGTHPRMDMDIKTGTVRFNDILILSKAFLDSLSIPNELNKITAEGSLVSDCHIKTNFKKLKSNGYVKVQNGGVSVRNLGKVLSKANINVILDNNILDIQDSGILIGNSKVNIDGKIDEKSVADISINTEKIPLPLLFNAFAPREIREAYNFNSGDAMLNLGVNGKLKKAVASAKFSLNNFDLRDKGGNFAVADKNFASEFFCDTKTLKGKLDNDGFKISLPKTGSQISVPNLNVEIAENNITVKENPIIINDKTTLKYSGEIIDYNKLKSINFALEGGLNTSDLVKLAGNELKSFIHYSGVLPLKVTVDGNGKKQTLFAQLLADKSDFITPVDFAELANIDTSLQAVIDFKPERLKIKKTGLFKRTVSVDKKGNEVVSLSEIAGVDGTIAGDRINLIKMTMPKALTGKIYAFPDSEFNVKGRAFVFGEASSPRMRGGFNLSNLSIPELLMTVRNANLQFKGHEADFDVKDILLNGSDIQAKGTISLLPDNVINILDLDVASRYINADKLMKVSELAMKYVPQAPASSANSAPADIPVTIRNGTIDMARIISGQIDIRNTRSLISMARNIFYLRNLRTEIFDGNVNGNISVNLITTLLDIKVRGNNINVEKALLYGAGMKDTLSGTASFDTDISLKGATYEEQMRSLKGNVNFDVKDGQFGPFGKLENLIIAENIRESQFFQTTLGGVISGLLTIDTTHFSDLNGSLSFHDGICVIDPITSLGNILSLHVFGEFDLLRNYADMKVRARMASLISNLLGPIGAINPANLINSAASLNVITAKAFSIFCEMVPEEEIAILPSFSNSYVDNAATKFQIVVRGDVAKPFTLVKSFKWLATASEYESAVEYVNSLPEPEEGSEEATIEEAKALEAEKQTLKYKIKHIFIRDKKNPTKETPAENTEEAKTAE